MRHLLLLLVLFIAAPVLHAAAQDARTITASGEAVVYVVPDEIVVALGIENFDEAILEAKEAGAAALERTLAALTALGIEPDDVQTDHLSIAPWYDGGRTPDDLAGYHARNALVVTLSDAALLEDVVTEALRAGVNYVHHVDFQTKAFKAHREQARTLALAAAREKAEKMAAALGQQLGDPVTIAETYNGSHRWFYSSWSDWGAGYGRGMSQNVLQNAQGGEGSASGALALGKIPIQAGVDVTFELRN